MIQDFTKEEMDPSAGSRDTEFTLGGGTILALGGALIVLCAICFGLGYAAGHRSSPESSGTSVVPAAGGAASSRAAVSGSKPGAAGQSAVQPKTQAQVAVSPDDAAASTPHSQPVSAVGAVGSEGPEVKPAIESAVHPALSVQNGGPSSPLQVQPAMAQTKGWMVQIAAVSHAEDAEVLVNALRKRGYVVTARRELGDSLIHVQTGPFVNRNDANAIRQKLLGDGYNAIVQ